MLVTIHRNQLASLSQVHLIKIGQLQLPRSIQVGCKSPDFCRAACLSHSLQAVLDRLVPLDRAGVHVRRRLEDGQAVDRVE
eukprot:7620481-Pyramimonas_sp.AAC.1